MGSVGFSEIAVIAIIALFVLGPDRLPQAARSIGKAISEFKRLTSGARADLEDALDATGMRETLAEIRGTVDEMNPRRIVQESLRSVDSIGAPVGTSDGSPSPFDSVVLPPLAQIAPPDADVAGWDDESSPRSPQSAGAGASNVMSPQLSTGFASGFKDILDDDL